MPVLSSVCAQASSQRLRWEEFILPSTLQLAPLMELLIWQIQDEGLGVPRSARLGSLPQSLDARCGRGIYLIHQCFEDVRWSRRGNRLQLACRRPQGA